MLALLPLVGVWAGSGVGVVASSGEQFAYRQRLRFAHDGRPFLAYGARADLLADDGTVLRPGWRETGFWRPGAEPDDVEVLLAAAAGQVLVLAGRAGDNRWDLSSVVLAPAPSARAVTGERRLYAVQGNDLLYATELDTGSGFAPHLNARLARVPNE